MTKELKQEKQNVIGLMVERDNLNEQLAIYKKLWSELKKILNHSMRSGQSLYRKTKNDMWLHYADSDKAVLERMQEMEVLYGTSDNL